MKPWLRPLTGTGNISGHRKLRTLLHPKTCNTRPECARDNLGGQHLVVTGGSRKSTRWLGRMSTSPDASAGFLGGTIDVQFNGAGKGLMAGPARTVDHL